MNSVDFIVFDFETGGLNPEYNEAIQVAGKAYNYRTLEPYPVEAGGEFYSLMKPLHFDRLEDGALKVNKLTREQLEKAPDQKVVWNQFVAWVGRYNSRGNNWTAPIACGKNIRDFDLKFVDVLNRLHCPKKEKTVLFHRTKFDLEDPIFLWFENEPEPAKYNMDALREYFGMETEGAHDALVDVRQTGQLLMKFLKLHREFQKRRLVKFKGSLAKVS